MNFHFNYPLINLARLYCRSSNIHRELIERYTEVSVTHLTPEIKLNLIRDEIGSEEKIASEISRIIESHKETDYACGLRDLLSLIHDRELQALIVEALEKEGFKIPLNPSEDTRNQTSKEWAGTSRILLQTLIFHV